jgi:hypothetical protein
MSNTAFSPVTKIEYVPTGNELILTLEIVMGTDQFDEYKGGGLPAWKAALREAATLLNTQGRHGDIRNESGDTVARYVVAMPR